MDDQLRRIEAKLDELSTKVGETHTSMFTRGGAFDRLDAVEKKTNEVYDEVGAFRAKVVFAASCVSAAVALIWAVVSKFWTPHN
jgi:tetrahydromethanopterin S-methyltransferase subunit G